MLCLAFRKAYGFFLCSTASSESSMCNLYSFIICKAVFISEGSFAKLYLSGKGHLQSCVHQRRVICKAVFVREGSFAKLCSSAKGHLQSCICQGRVICKAVFIREGSFAKLYFSGKGHLQSCIHQRRASQVVLSTTKVKADSNYSQLSLSRLRLSRITAYLAEKNLVLVLTQKSKIRLQNIVEKRRNCSWGAISPLFHNISKYISN